ncbi:FMN-dependent NADH-azoreductase [Cronobacter dublinensis]|uniref:FMN-dependent NADH-azoreductase n=1 Tax=Cronobacter dublinensis TaxID=413497 RepID=UPI00137585B9|nr:NAD(P)H-dependent oxidoreductase [Cronobacter dublinensis]NCH98018.1 FMN-dependent NADH-azoreductase [Cronobacter dublinensis]
MKILHIDSSFNDELSVTRHLSGEVVRKLTESGHYKEVIYRDVVKDELHHLTAKIAAGFRPVPGKEHSTEEEGNERLLSETLVKEFLDSDVVVIGAPMYNFSVPTQLKAWLDRLAQPGKTFRYTAAGPEGLAGGKKVIIASARGGFYEKTPLAGMDFQEKYLQTFFGFLGITDVVFIRAEGVSRGEEIKQQEIAKARFSINEIL